jgi:hypothetical protein
LEVDLGAERLYTLHEEWPRPEFGIALGQRGFERTAHLEKVGIRKHNIFSEVRRQQDIQLPAERVDVSLECRVDWLLHSPVHLHQACCHDLPPDLCKSAA